MSDDVTKSESVKLALIALGTLVVFCFMAWSMFADSRTAQCVTKARLAARDDVRVHDVRWTVNAGCEFFASILKPGLTAAEKRKAITSKADALWMPEARVMRNRGGR